MWYDVGNNWCPGDAGNIPRREHNLAGGHAMVILSSGVIFGNSNSPRSLSFVRIFAQFAK
jgi:hypothetical protein